MSFGQLPHFNSLGRWWDNNTEIDLVGLNEEDNSILFVETRWSNQPLRTDVLDNLKQKSRQVTWGNPGKKEYYVLVSKGGFSTELVAKAKTDGVLLIHGDKVVI
jgi:AAA+ ATPase superfamily predicted ATPase